MAAVLMAVVTLFSGTIMVVAFALTGVGVAIYNGLLSVYVSDMNQDVGNGALMGLLTVTFCIGNSIIAIIGSFVLKILPSAPMILGSGLIVLSSILMVKYLYGNGGSGKLLGSSS